MGSFLIVLALVVFVLGELAVVVQKNRNRRAGQADSAEPARGAGRRPRRRAAMSMLVVGIMLFVISAIVIMNAVYLRQSGPVVIETENGETIIHQQPSQDPRRVFALPVVLMIGGAALGLFVGRYRAEVKEWQEPSEEESAPAAPTKEKSNLPPDAAQKKREELAHLLDAGLLTKEEYREKLKKLE